ncbi:MAG: hypothetical protein QNK44_07925 [Hyphomicrobiaceae bacterium]|nr:hypothetical protein [Hyphomicrobiaceae bacterium]
MSQAFPTKFIKADDIGAARPTVIIADVRLEDVGDDAGPKPVAYFHGKEKGMVLNKTNAEMIAHLYGDETDAWRGQSIDLYTTMVQYGGKSLLGIRVMAPAPQMPAHQAPPPVAQRPIHPAPNPNVPISDFATPPPIAPTVAQPGGGDLDDEIPF